MKNHRISVIRGTAMTAAFILLSIYDLGQAAPAAVPSSADATAQAVRELQDQVRQLRSMVETMRAENAQSTSEMHQLRQDLQATRALLEPSLSSGTATTVATGNTTPTSDATPPVVETSSQKAPSIDDRVQKLEESTSLMGSKIDEQYQTKVETASKYRARLHGIVLMNAFRNVGSSDNLDFPTYADPVRFGSPTANMGATLRQSEIGLEIFGPNVAGAKTSADIQFDFSGGLPATGNGVDFGVVRMQTASLRFDWQKTSVVAGQDSLFISPLSPTSFASLATPAFAFAGNLWAWTPQIRVEHRFLISDRQTISLQAGIVDNLDWEPPYNCFYRTPQAGELSGQPAYAFRTAWSGSVQDRALRFGVAGYYGRQNWRWDRKNDAWAGMADWQIPISSRLELTGRVLSGPSHWRTWRRNRYLHRLWR